ncbi:breast cancer metastasis-suppressor 1-like protein [Huso huso]|uniref:Breast cancer metastasis-suppressor 1-like protein n=1 Tax=Huso huso TaxID=61971 RepID=A0ABR0Y139_HUSHU
MPVQPTLKEPEEMEVEGDSTTEANGEEEEEEEEEEESGSESETEPEEESSEMDDEDCERRRIECLDEMSDLEKQFMDLKEKLFKERLNQVKAKLEEVIAGTATEYIEPVAALQKNMKIRTEVAGVYRDLCLQVIHNKYDCEMQGARQHMESEKLLLFDNMQNELMEKIQRLEEDRQTIDISSEWWNDKLHSKKSRRRCDPTKPEKKRKPVLVSGPYIVYMLQDISILEDWTAIKKAKATVLPMKKKSEPKIQYSAKCEDGKLYYEGECYSKGHVILLEIREDPPSQAVITAVSTGEVWLRRTDGSKTKIYVSQLQKGKYTIRKA